MEIMKYYMFKNPSDIKDKAEYPSYNKDMVKVAKQFINTPILFKINSTFNKAPLFKVVDEKFDIGWNWLEKWLIPIKDDGQLFLDFKE